ncbi:hypothetical protein CDL15_Pgr003394 [Punica granatum]|uniref:Kynurenine formamidase-like n=1 Tax=Punica granatum TaxID=22663 RepID=A0A218X4D7_PUNGR|nr:hypothetical protein CDL15_Pgr003394 [Punica granatum]
MFCSTGICNVEHLKFKGIRTLMSCLSAGIDYLSIAAFDDDISSHLALLESREIIVVEGLKLDDVPTGLYNVHCLPLRFPGAEGSPIRCILME